MQISNKMNPRFYFSTHSFSRQKLIQKNANTLQKGCENDIDKKICENLKLLAADLGSCPDVRGLQRGLFCWSSFIIKPSSTLQLKKSQYTDHLVEETLWILDQSAVCSRCDSYFQRDIVICERLIRMMMMMTGSGSRSRSGVVGCVRWILPLVFVITILLTVTSIPAPGSFAPQDLDGLFQLELEGSSGDCPDIVEHVKITGEKTGGFMVTRSFDDEECEGMMRVIPGGEGLGGDVGRSVQQLESNVKGLMSGVDGGCGGLEKGSWVFVRESSGGDKSLTVGGKSVKLVSGERNGVFVEDGGKGRVCRFLGVTERKRRRKRPKIPSGGGGEEEEEDQQDDDQQDDDEQQQDDSTAGGVADQGNNDSSDSNNSTSASDRLSECFPADGWVVLEGGAVRPMEKVKIGDRVLVAVNGENEKRFSEVVLFTHRDASARASFVKITTNKDSNNALYVTPGHYLYVNNKLVAAESVRAGDKVQRIAGEDVVVSVERVMKDGLYNPQTMHGDIVVNGVLTSTFTTAVHPTIARGLMVPVKAAYTCGLPLFQGLFDSGAGRFSPVVRLFQLLLPAYK